MLSGNASDAYRKAGYGAKDANVCGPRLLADARVQAEIARLTAEKHQKWDIDADELVQRVTQLVLADPGQITQHRVGACRYCYGIDHEFQWTTKREFRKALLQAELRLSKKPTKKEKESLPSDEGGFGYDRTRPPNEDCPECNGLGIGYVTIADTTTLTGPERLLFDGIKETRNGIEVKLADRQKNLEILAKHLGILKDNHQLDLSDPLKRLLEAAQGSALMPGAGEAPAAPSYDAGASSQSAFMPSDTGQKP